eukprot:900114-Rhodomonas_salina.2
MPRRGAHSQPGLSQPEPQARAADNIMPRSLQVEGTYNVPPAPAPAPAPAGGRRTPFPPAQDHDAGAMPLLPSLPVPVRVRGTAGATRDTASDRVTVCRSVCSLPLALCQAQPAAHRPGRNLKLGTVPIADAAQAESLSHRDGHGAGCHR